MTDLPPERIAELRRCRNYDVCLTEKELVALLDDAAELAQVKFANAVLALTAKEFSDAVWEIAKRKNYRDFDWDVCKPHAELLSVLKQPQPGDSILKELTQVKALLERATSEAEQAAALYQAASRRADRNETEMARLGWLLAGIEHDCNEMTQVIAFAGTHGPSLSKGRISAVINVIYKKAIARNKVALAGPPTSTGSEAGS